MLVRSLICYFIKGNYSEADNRFVTIIMFKQVLFISPALIKTAPLKTFRFRFAQLKAQIYDCVKAKCAPLNISWLCRCFLYFAAEKIHTSVYQTDEIISSHRRYWRRRKPEDTEPHRLELPEEPIQLFKGFTFFLNGYKTRPGQILTSQIVLLLKHLVVTNHTLLLRMICLDFLSYLQ